MRRFSVTVTNTDHDGNQTKQQMYLKSHWAINAQRPLAYTLEFKLIQALAQRTATNVMENYAS